MLTSSFLESQNYTPSPQLLNLIPEGFLLRNIKVTTNQYIKEVDKLDVTQMLERSGAIINNIPPYRTVDSMVVTASNYQSSKVAIDVLILLGVLKFGDTASGCESLSELVNANPESMHVNSNIDHTRKIKVRIYDSQDNNVLFDGELSQS